MGVLGGDSRGSFIQLTIHPWHVDLTRWTFAQLEVMLNFIVTFPNERGRLLQMQKRNV
jgi:hypothetical protein